MNPCVIGFSGRIKSGKTTISRAIAEHLRWPCSSFGDYVRAVAKDRGLTLDSRVVLQEVGETLIEAGWPKFCHDVLAMSGWQPGMSLIVDGIRHVDAVDEISRTVAPLRFFLIHVGIDEMERIERIHVHDLKDYSLTELHSTETDVKDALPSMALLVVDGTKAIDIVMEDILTSVKAVLLRPTFSEGE
ncbi:MAG: AAA family ATPase [Planctomycetes bacterium]|nr:AAA family ATPase [Planctomycetota bacterium]